MATIDLIKSQTVSKLLPSRSKNSHKGENGRVLIVAGSKEYHGAAILAGMGALSSGADLVTLYVPEFNFEVTRNACPDFIVKSFPGEFLSERYSQEIIEFAKKKADSILLGPGLTDRENTVDAVVEIIENLNLPTVLDSSAMLALKKIRKFPLQQEIVITPHSNEFRHLVDREVAIRDKDTKSIILLRSISMDLHINILLKGHVDYISSNEGYVEKNSTGNPGMTVGGTGDVLAGMAATLMAKKMQGYDAARAAAYINGAAGDILKKERGMCFSASDLANKLPYAIAKL